ncbi:MAG: NADH-quinone oxidoreductase subunit N [bacterium ADurb.BinA186]|nr:MAG: NADH-quinone oxidoreductase subunit N [bacterium ADurb.BinA186]
MGFLLIALMAHSPRGVEAILLDLTAFSVSIILILATLNSLHVRWSQALSIVEFKGLCHQHPLHAMVLIVSLFSIIGFPLTAGFIGKYSLFMATVDAHFWSFLPHMILASLITLAALARLIFIMFQPAEFADKKLGLSGFILAGALALIILGIFPEPLIFWIKAQSAHLAILR